MRIHLRSLKVLVVASFALVSIPLLAAVVLAATYVDGLPRESANTVIDSVRIARQSQLLFDLLTSLERAARQYQVLGDPELLHLYGIRHERLLGVLSQLRASSIESSAEAEQLETTAQEILDALDAGPQLAQDAISTIPRFEELYAQAHALNAVLNTRIDEKLEELEASAAHVRRMLHLQAAALIPLAALIAAVFSHLIVGPIRSLGRAILQIGDGRLSQPVLIGGPRDIARLGLRLDWLRRRLHALEEDKKTFLRNVSHELKTPLTNLREGAELLLDGGAGPGTQNQREIATILQSNSIALQRSIENLLAFNAWQEHKDRLDCCEVLLPQLIDEVLAQHRLLLERRGVQVELRIRLHTLWADAAKLRIVLDNLVSNALKMSPPRGRVRISSGRSDGDRVELRVSDDGPGVPEHERESVFEPFRQGSNTGIGPVRGTGIGLSVVRACVQAHNGQVWITDGELHGASIVVRLPRHPPPASG